MSVRKILIILVFLLMLVIIIQNSQAVTIQFLFWKVSMSGILLFPLIFLIGAATGWLIALFLKNN